MARPRRCKCNAMLLLWLPRCSAAHSHTHRVDGRGWASLLVVVDSSFAESRLHTCLCGCVPLPFHRRAAARVRRSGQLWASSAAMITSIWPVSLLQSFATSVSWALARTWTWGRWVAGLLQPKVNVGCRPYISIQIVKSSSQPPNRHPSDRVADDQGGSARGWAPRCQRGIFVLSP